MDGVKNDKGLWHSGLVKDFVKQGSERIVLNELFLAARWREFEKSLAEKTLKSVYFKRFGAFFGDPFLATIFWPERSHAAWRSFLLAPERSHAAWRSFLDRDFFSCEFGGRMWDQ